MCRSEASNDRRLDRMGCVRREQIYPFRCPRNTLGWLDGVCAHLGGIFHSTSRFEMRKVSECINAFRSQ